MANELSVSISLNFQKSDAKLNIAEAILADVAGDAFSHNVQSIGFAAEEVLVESDALGTPGYVFVKNLDATNFVHVGLVKVSVDKDAMPIKLLAGQICVFPAGAAIYAMADTAACNVKYAIVEL